MPAHALPTQVEPAAGQRPRHFAFHPDGRRLYPIQEEGCTIVRFDWDGASGRLTPRQTISSLPPGYAGSSFCSETLVSADGRFVYVGNRLHDSIGIFAAGPSGELTFAGREWMRGNYLSSVAVDPTNRFPCCCNQRADNVTVFRAASST